jgi:hypothetical protein
MWFMLLGMLFFVVLGIIATNVLGWAYYSFAPTSTFLDVRGFYAQDVNISQTHSQTITMERKASLSMLFYGVSRLELVDNKNTVVYIRNINSAFEASDGVVASPKVVQIPDDIKEGNYHWRTVISLKLPFGVERNVEIVTNTFKVES